MSSRFPSTADRAREMEHAEVRIDGDTIKVRSSDGSREYTIWKSDSGTHCNCQHHHHTGAFCKHQKRAAAWLRECELENANG